MGYCLRRHKEQDTTEHAHKHVVLVKVFKCKKERDLSRWETRDALPRELTD